MWVVGVSLVVRVMYVINLMCDLAFLDKGHHWYNLHNKPHK